MTSKSPLARHIWLPTLLVGGISLFARPASAQPGPDDPPATYEVQIDGESFQVESGQRPIKVESKLKKGTTYTLAVRVALNQVLRLNTVRMEYGMWAKVEDDNGKNIRFAKIFNRDIGLILSITDVGHAMGKEHADKLLDTLVDAAVKRHTDDKATHLEKKGPIPQKFGISSGKGTRITYRDDRGLAHTTMIFVLSGENYTVGAEAEFADQYFDDAMPWIRAALSSIRPLH